MKKLILGLGLLGLAGCDADALGGYGGSASAIPDGPAIEIVEAGRAADTTRVVMRYRDGGEIPVSDEARAVARAAGIACQDGEDAIPDTRARDAGLLTVNFFCTGVTVTDEIIDGTGLT